MSLEARLQERIQREGPISFYEWMKSALYDEREGYYCRRDIVRRGRLGDYRTAPERTPLFAATFAQYFAKLFTELGSPRTWVIIETGAGFGEFAADILRSLQSRHPAIFAATRYLVDEFSEDGRDRAAANLAGFENSYEFCRIDELGTAFPTGILFSNELIDAFPVHRVIGRNGELRELYVDVDAENRFVWREGQLDSWVAEYCERIHLQLAEGQIAESSPDAEAYIARAARLINCGFVITVDYGDERRAILTDPYRQQGTLRAAYHHQIGSDVLLQPGRRDLTTTIDWTQLRDAGERVGLRSIRYEPLDQFLLSEGIIEELERRSSGLNPAEAAALRAGAREMILPVSMAASFQVLVQKKSR